MNKDVKGVAPVAIIIIVAAVLDLAGGGWWWYYRMYRQQIDFQNNVNCRNLGEEWIKSADNLIPMAFIGGVPKSTYHFNKKLNTCLIDVYNYSTTVDNASVRTDEWVVDVLSNKGLAETHEIDDAKGNVSMIPTGDLTQALSRDDFVKKYKELFETN